MKILNFKYLITELSPIFKQQYLTDDLVAGLTVASISIPLSLAIALASGVSPELGLISSIIGGIIGALLGGTRLGVTGPAAAMSVLIASTIENNGFSGLLIVGMICGLLQIISGFLNLGRYTKLAPLAVISSFTAAIGFIIIVGQLPQALQLPSPDQNHVFAVIKHIGSYITKMNPMAFILAIITFTILKVLPKYYPKVPTPLIAVLIPTLLVYLFDIPDIILVSPIPQTLQIPAFPDFSAITNWQILITSGFEVFILASLETLLSSAAVDSMGRGDLHNSNQELIGQGVANFLVSIFGGIPVTGVIARSSVNIAAGARTRRSPIISSLIILLVVYFFSKFVEMIPVAVLAGILLAAGISMINIKEIIKFWQIDKSELITYIATFILILSTDFVQGVQAGIMVAFLIVGLKMLVTKSNVKLWSNGEVLRISLSGSMTFWSFERLAKLERYIFHHEKLQVVIFDFSDLAGIDMTGASHLKNTGQELLAHGINPIFHALSLTQERLFTDVLFIKTLSEHEIKTELIKLNISYHAIDILRHGAEKFIVNYARERQELLNELALGQKPHTLLITCADSRINPNALFSSDLGELFIIRNAGNIINKYEFSVANETTAAIEFALGVLEIRNIVICAHSDCGAIKSCVYDTNINYPNLKIWLQQIKTELNPYAPLDLDQAIKRNLLNQIENLTTFPLVKELLATNKLNIAAWMYDVKSAEVLLWDQINNCFSPLITVN